MYLRFSEKVLLGLGSSDSSGFLKSVPVYAIKLTAAKKAKNNWLTGRSMGKLNRASTPYPIMASREKKAMILFSCPAVGDNTTLAV